MLNNELIYNVWGFLILVLLVINTRSLLKNRTKMKNIDKVFNRIKSLID